MKLNNLLIGMASLVVAHLAMYRIIDSGRCTVIIISTWFAFWIWKQDA